MRLLAVPLLLLGSAAFAQSTTGDPRFGEHGEFYWQCEATITNERGEMSGTWRVGDEDTGPTLVRWTSPARIVIGGNSETSIVTQSVVWHPASAEAPFGNGLVYLDWQAPVELPAVVLANVGGSLREGGALAVVMQRPDSMSASASFRLERLLEWAGGLPNLRIGLNDIVADRELGAGSLPIAPLRALEGDYRAVMDQLRAKAARFEAQCQQVELMFITTSRPRLGPEFVPPPRN